MRSPPSDRNLAIVVYRDAGHTLQETAAKFGLHVETIRGIEWRVRDYHAAVEGLQTDPDNLMLLARAGRLLMRAGEALDAQGIHRIDQLRGHTFRDLIMMPNMGRACVEQIAKLAAERGIEIQ
jgi:DNA-directed RNA polymerase alpha subunit